ncbi:HAD-IIIC family phosphatase [Stappia sp. BW2]|uniref:HAD-IIIC family phosphatase n=1 Tax=Stappia sp. BW2 TaxID=2592622 RepID=UPI0011DECE33|nr:HAD-IIIC family phosphatase [Stappia sp. BW2]TYC67341.1 HAD-IIIC family phosphatase [Stappia sp. BW2]
MERKPQIKLVIWDLDETFWSGTLTEGGVTPRDECIEIVKNLAAKGIISSICSKNDHKEALDKLKEFLVDDYFVFPSIDWTPKGPRINRLIHEVGLRSENVLFIDDLKQNLEEAKYYSSDLNVLDASELSKIGIYFDVEGKNDGEFTRLQQYKINEKKSTAKREYHNNEEFLRNSEIVLTVDNAPLKHIDRVLELVNRTNQLNFTKRRFERQEAYSLLKDEGIETAVISCKDKYGNSGIIGFYALDRVKRELLDFVWSCRMMNSGIEQFIYREYLGSPKIDVVGPVSSDLTSVLDVDWLEIEEKEIVFKTVKKEVTIFFKGGCDLERITNGLNQDEFNVITEINGTTNGGIPFHHDHSFFLIQQSSLTKEKKDDIVGSWPFLDKNAFSSKIFEEQPDILIWSLLMDFTQELYVNVQDGHIVPFGGYNNVIKDETINYYKKRFPSQSKHLDAFKANIKENYLHAGQITKDIMRVNIDFIMDKMPDTHFVFVNAGEVAYRPSKERAAVSRHREMNEALIEFASRRERCSILDVKPYINSPEDLTNSIRHYQPHVYAHISEELKTLVEKIAKRKKI